MLVKRVEVESVEDCRRRKMRERGQKELLLGSGVLQWQVSPHRLVKVSQRGPGGDTNGTSVSHTEAAWPPSASR